MRRILFLVLAGLLLSSCVSQPSTIATPARIHSTDDATITLPSPSTTVASPLITHPTEYIDDSLCFAIEPPPGWKADGTHGAAVFFWRKEGEDFRIVKGGTTGTLQGAIANMRQGVLGPSIQEVKDFQVGNHPALWFSFAPGAHMDYQFLVIVISSDCGEGKYGLQISARGTEKIERETFEMFLQRIRFLRE